MCVCNEAGCGLRRSTHHVRLYITISQLLSSLKMSQKKRDVTNCEKANITRSLRDDALLRLPRHWGIITEQLNVLLQIVNRVRRKKRKMQINRQRIREKSSVKQPGSHCLPVLLYSTTAGPTTSWLLDLLWLLLHKTLTVNRLSYWKESRGLHWSLFFLKSEMLT